MTELTSRQQEVYEYLQQHFLENHYIPTCLQICDHFGFASENAAGEHLQRLVNAGYLKKSANQRWSFTKFNVRLEKKDG